VRAVDAALAAELEAIEHGSSATVTLAWRRSDVPHPLDAYGFVVPTIERRPTLASTWMTSKWPGRAPDGIALLRVFLGGAGRADPTGEDDASLALTARAELGDLIGVRVEPLLVRVDRFVRAMPQYEVGHLARVASLDARAAALPAFALAGTAYHGVGIPDAVKSGEAAAERIARAVVS
jgi:oxygen-dependent protoporphyrinogen oxidase